MHRLQLLAAAASIRSVDVYDDLVKVVQRGRFSVYVYREVGQPHHSPHCNVRWSDGDTQVELPTLRRIIGTPLPGEAQRLLAEYRDEIVAAWNQLNPERRTQA